MCHIMVSNELAHKLMSSDIAHLDDLPCRVTRGENVYNGLQKLLSVETAPANG
jgi:hypothetical protein